MSLEERISSLIVEQRNITRIMESLYNEVVTLQTSLEDRRNALRFLEKYGSVEEDMDVLFPVGGGLYLRAVIQPKSKIFRSVGAGVYLTDDVSKVIDVLKKNIEDLEKALEERNELLERYRARYDEITAELSELYFKLQGGERRK